MASTLAAHCLPETAEEAAKGALLAVIWRDGAGFQHGDVGAHLFELRISDAWLVGSDVRV